MDDLLALLDEAEESKFASDTEDRSNRKGSSDHNCHLQKVEPFALSAEERVQSAQEYE
jgi:hypothetical protein